MSWSKDLGIDLEENKTTAAFKEVKTLSALELSVDQEQLEKEIKDAEKDASKLSEATYDRNQVIDLCKNNLNFFAALALPEIFQYEFPETYITIWQLLIEALEKEKAFPQIALGIPRGHAKTTLIKLLCLYAILFSKKQFILVLAETAPKAEEITSDVADMLDQLNVRTVFGDWRAGMIKDTQAVKIFGYRSRTLVLAALGAGGSIRGLNIKNRRPDFIVFEDIQSRECADSDVQSNALERWMVGTAMKSKSPSGCLFVFVANMYPTAHSILKKLKINPRWIKFICGAILSDGKALWEELRSLESLLEEFDNDIEMHHPEIFFSEVLNETEVGQNNSVDFSKFKDWIWGEHDYPQGKFIVIDPSQGKGKDKDCIGYFEVYDGIVGFRQSISDHLSPGNLIKKALILAIKTNTRLIAVESMAYQYTLLYWFEEVCKAVGITGIVFVPIYMSTKSKNARITTGLKTLEAGEQVLHRDVRAIVQNEIANWNKLKRDNIDDHLDVLSYAPIILRDHAYDILTPMAPLVLESLGAKVDENNHMF